MIAAAALAAALAQPLPAAPAAASGNWVVVAVQRVIAPDQMQGQCFIQGRVERVVRGRAFRAGDAIGLSLACRFGGFTPAQATHAPAVPTIQTLRSQKRALVHVDAAGRVLENGYYGFGALIRPGPAP
jgi:hypothetical protein